MKKIIFLLIFIFINAKTIQTPKLDYRMDECGWDNNTNTYEIKNYGTLDNDYNATALNDANVTNGKICNGGDINATSEHDKAIKLKSDYALPDEYTLNVWIKFPLNTNGHKTFKAKICTFSFFGICLSYSYKYYKYFNIADRKGSGYDYIFFADNITDNTWTLNVNDDNGGDSYDLNPQNLNGWHMLTFVVNNKKTKFYLDGDKTNTFSTHPNTGYLGLLFNSDYKSNTDNTPNGQSIGSDVDEFELYSSDLSKNDISTLYDNENSGKNYDGSERVCPICNNNSSETNYSFNAVTKIIYNSANKDWDNNLTTQIANNNFDLYILSKDKDTGENKKAAITKVVFMYYDNGDNTNCSGTNEENQTVCDDSTSTNCPDTNSSGEAKISDVNVSKAVKCIKVHIEGMQLDTTNSNPALQEANSTDDFAVRPKEFNITNIPEEIKAGSEFNLTIKALDENSNDTKDYNETLSIKGDSPEINYTDKKSNCITGNLNKKAGGDFKDGETNVTLTYSEVGELNITVKEINGSEFAKVDNDDTPLSSRLIKEKNITLAFIPHHFDRNATLSNGDSGFTYYDYNLSKKALIDLNITAKNEQNETTKNYNEKCYSKNIEINVSLNKLYNGDINVSKIRYFYEDTNDNNSSVYEVGLNDDLNISNYDKSNFTTDNNGSTEIRIYFNFDRNISNPSSPMEVNISEINVSDANISDTNQTYVKKDGNATFFYGNLNMNDIVTTKDDFNISHEFVIYDSNESDTLIPDINKETLLYWFLNLYNKTKDANITNFVVTKGYVYKDNDIISSSDVNISVNEINESLNLHVERKNEGIKFAVVHIIDTNASYLWYSKFGNEYNISKNSSCANHFCFAITWENNETVSGVVSGETNGTKSDVNSSGIKQMGVKIFR